MNRHVLPPTTRADAQAPAALAVARAGANARCLAASTEPSPLRLWILSDFRIDLAPFDLPPTPPEFDAVVVAGGVGPGLCRSVRWLAWTLDAHRGSRPVVFVPGPAEFCDGVPVGEALAEALPLARELGITLLHDAAIRLGSPERAGLHVIGATLWPSFTIDGAETARAARAHARHRWSVKGRAASAPGVPFFPHDAAGAHARSRAFVEDALSSIATASGSYGHGPAPVIPNVSAGDRAIVVTAYPPSRSCLPPALAQPLLDPWRVCWHASDLDAVMTGWGAPAAWVHGSVPVSCDLRIGRTRVVSNSYDPRAPLNGFDARRTVLV